MRATSWPIPPSGIALSQHPLFPSNIHHAPPTSITLLQHPSFSSNIHHTHRGSVSIAFKSHLLHYCRFSPAVSCRLSLQPFVCIHISYSFSIGRDGDYPCLGCVHWPGRLYMQKVTCWLDDCFIQSLQTYLFFQATFDFRSTNPVLRNITDYLVEEGSYEEDELLGKGRQLLCNVSARLCGLWREAFTCDVWSVRYWAFNADGTASSVWVLLRWVVVWGGYWPEDASAFSRWPVVHLCLPSSLLLRL